MQRFVLWACVAAALCVASASTRADDRTAAAILEDIDKVEVPKFDPKIQGDPKAIQDYITKSRQASQKKGELAFELYHVDPENARLPKLMRERWQNRWNMSNTRPDPALTAEIDEVLAHSRNEALRTEAFYAKAEQALRSPRPDLAATRDAIESFTRQAPRDERGALLLVYTANQTGDAKEQAEIYRKIVDNYSNSRYAEMARGSLKKAEAVGKPFDLEFKEAITGKTIAMKDLRGKVVVVDFWATWCGPCVAEMPKMKKLYADYRDKGVEFIGVSLDQPEGQGGLEKLKAFVEKNEIAWPQYYQGNGWESDFSKSWGINSIPAVFVVDKEGKLSSVQARGQLEKMIPALLGIAPEPVVAAEVPDPSVPSTGKDVSGFQVWNYDKDERGLAGTFKKEDGTQWVEMKDGKVFAHFEEVKRTPEFIELFDKGRSMSVRLYDTRIYWRTADQERWNLMPFSANGKEH